VDELGKRIQKMGCALTLLLTLPIAGLVFFGFLGLIVGGAIGLLLGVGMLKAPESKV
jgi:hypothetical protein